MAINYIFHQLLTIINLRRSSVDYRQHCMKTGSLSRLTKFSLKSLGGMIQVSRKERRISQTNLAERLNVSRYTVIALEKGDPKVAIGIVFEAAHIVGIPLLAEDEIKLQKLSKTVSQFNALLPQRIRKKERPADDYF